jgi:hypothetical protein
MPYVYAYTYCAYFYSVYVTNDMVSVSGLSVYMSAWAQLVRSARLFGQHEVFWNVFQYGMHRCSRLSIN